MCSALSLISLPTCIFNFSILAKVSHCDICLRAKWAHHGLFIWRKCGLLMGTESFTHLALISQKRLMLGCIISNMWSVFLSVIEIHFSNVSEENKHLKWLQNALTWVHVVGGSGLILEKWTVIKCTVTFYPRCCNSKKKHIKITEGFGVVEV